MLLRRNEISFLFQNFGLMESRTIVQNLPIGLQYSHLSTKEKNIRMLQALEQTGLDKPLNTHVYNLRAENSSGWPWHASFSSLQDLSWPTSRPGHLIQGTEISS